MTAPERPPRRIWPLAGLGALLVFSGLLLHSPWLSLKQIEVVGAGRSDPAAAVAAAGVGEGAFLIWIDTGKVEAEVASDPWVAAVQVDRVWPSTLRVEVVEREPLVLVEGDSGWMLVASDGRVVEVTAQPAGAYLRASLALAPAEPGTRPVDPVWTEVVELALVLRDDIGATLHLRLQGSEVWTEALGYEVRMGAPIDLADKGRTLRSLLSAAAIEPGSIIDISSPSRPAIVPPGSSQVEVEGSDEET